MHKEILLFEKDLSAFSNLDHDALVAMAMDTSGIYEVWKENQILLAKLKILPM